MNLQVLLPIVSKAVGRDLTPDAEMFFRARAAIGNSLTPQGQVFFMENWRKIVPFMETPEGQAAISQFMNAWAKAMVPKMVEEKPPSQTPNIEPNPPDFSKM